MATYNVPAFNPNVCTKIEAELISAARSGNPFTRSTAYNSLFGLYYRKNGEESSKNKGSLNKCAYKVAWKIQYDFEWVKLQNTAKAAKNPLEKKALQADADQYLLSDVIVGFNNALKSYDFVSMPFKNWINKHISWTLKGIKRKLAENDSREKKLSDASIDYGDSISLSRCKKRTRKVKDAGGNEKKVEQVYFDSAEIDNGKAEAQEQILKGCVKQVLQQVGSKNPELAEKLRAVYNSYEVNGGVRYAAALYKERTHKSSYSHQALKQYIKKHHNQITIPELKDLVKKVLSKNDQVTTYGEKKTNKNTN